MEVDYMHFFKLLVKEEKIAPSEVWQLDIQMVKVLLSDYIKTPMDLTVMLNAERAMNGAPREILNYGD